MPALDNSVDCMKALIAKLYAIVTGDDPAIKVPRNKFVTWLLPGVPFDLADFMFCAKGFIAPTAEETNDRYHEAFILSKLCDFVPDVNTDFVDGAMQQTMFSTVQDAISSIYNDVLRYSKVVNRELSREEKEKIQRFRNLLTVTKEVENLLTGEKETRTEPGPLVIAYNTYMNNFIDEYDAYINVKIDAMSAKGSDPEAIRRVHAAAMADKVYRKKVEAAELAWVAQGYKNEYEQITSYLNQVLLKSMVLYKQDLLFKYGRGLLSSPADGGMDFYYTTLLPGNFATSPGWTRFTYFHEDFASHYEKSTSKWAGKGGFLGPIAIGAKAGGSKESTFETQKASDFRAEFEFTQIPICRPWFDPGFFSMRGWTLDDMWNLNFGDKKVSDGAEKPVGRLVAYPVTALFVRNVKFRFKEAQSMSQSMTTAVGGGGALAWGPFAIGGSASRGKETRDVKSTADGNSLDVAGMQLIGFVNNIIPKCPDPHPDIKPHEFVGGA
jgi:hypothetical protein